MNAKIRAVLLGLAMIIIAVALVRNATSSNNPGGTKPTSAPTATIPAGRPSDTAVPPPGESPTPSPSSTPTPSPTPIEEPLLVLCASDAVSANDQTFGDGAYDTLNRYLTTRGDVQYPDLDMIVGNLYAGSINVSAGCQDSSRILKTDSTHWNRGIETVKFIIPSGRRAQLAKFWVIMSARDTVTIGPSEQIPVAQILGEFEHDTGSTSKRELRTLLLGQDIADWTFRGTPEGQNEQYTIAYIRPKAVDTRRVFIGYERNSDQSRSSLRAAQLFAVGVDLSQESGNLKSISITDLWDEVGLDIFAVVLVPEGFPEPTPQPPARQEPICLDRDGSSPDVDDRIFTDDVQRISSLDPIEIGCDVGSYTIIAEVAPQVHFWFKKILATRREIAPPPIYHPKIILNVDNTIDATHLYLILAVRNLCLPHPTSDGLLDEQLDEPFVVGHIIINGEQYDLRAGDNVRQGRTNHTLSGDGCSGGREVLYIPPPRQQQDYPRIQGQAGIPLRAEPNARIDYAQAELWLDLIKIALPDDGREELVITIENSDSQTAAGTEPFITLYAATLVKEER